MHIIATGDAGLPKVSCASIEDSLAIACQRAVRDMTHGEWDQYKGNKPYRETGPEVRP